MKKNIKYLYYSLFAVIAIWSIWSLSYSPIAWYDEVYYASTTHSLISGNGLSLEIYNNEPVLVYGPVYFLLTGAVAKIFGLGVFQFRIVNLFFAFLTVIVLGKLLDKLNVKKWLNYFLQILVLADSYFITNSHSGRMEFVALFFVMMTYWLYLNKDIKLIYQAVGIAVFLTLSALTTTRAVIICIPIAVAQFIRIIKLRSWSSTALYISIPVVLFGIWVFIAFGSLTGFISYFTQQETGDLAQGSFVSTYLKGNWLISKFHYPMIVVTLLSIGYLVKIKKVNDIVLSGITILLYYFLVFDTGMYSVYILPFYMIIIGIGVSEMSKTTNKVINVAYKSLLVICLLINFSILSAKAINIFSEKELRNPELAVDLFEKYIPKGSKVAGDYAFYYAAIQHGCQFKCTQRGGVDSDVVIEEILNKYQPDYIVLGKNNTETEKLPLFQASGFEKSSCLECNRDKESSITSLLKKLNFTVTTTYEGCVFTKKQTESVLE